jgi:ADP-ribose pyrophosphatase YjhB (NUDIX family)
MTQYVHPLAIEGRVVTLSWVGRLKVEPARVYAMAFVSKDEMLLVSGGPKDPHRWLPGGGIEAGETPEQALRRELIEEADASIVALKELGSSCMDDPQSGREYHRVYWCRITLADQVFPRQSVRFVTP